jgi:hypothetical protein
MSTATASPEAILFSAKDNKELNKELTDRYGQDVARILERATAKNISTIDQQKVLKDLGATGVNGNAESLLKAYSAHSRQIGIRDSLHDRWYHKLGRGVSKVGHGVKETLMAPLRGVKYAFKKHPILTSAAVAALAGYLAYAYGLPLAQFGGEGGDVKTGKIAQIVRKLTKFAPVGEKPGVGRVGIPKPEYGDFETPEIELP